MKEQTSEMLMKSKLISSEEPQRLRAYRLQAHKMALDMGPKSVTGLTIPLSQPTDPHL